MEKKIGIWLDSEKAYIITTGQQGETIKEVQSNIDHFKIHGGAGTSTPFQAQDATSDSKIMEKKKHQLKNYFTELMTIISDASCVAIFGPAQTKTAFQAELQKNSNLRSKLIAVETADGHLSENQLKELVRDFYKKNK